MRGAAAVMPPKRAAQRFSPRRHHPRRTLNLLGARGYRERHRLAHRDRRSRARPATAAEGHADRSGVAPGYVCRPLPALVAGKHHSGKNDRHCRSVSPNTVTEPSWPTPTIRYNPGSSSTPTDMPSSRLCSASSSCAVRCSTPFLCDFSSTGQPCWNRSPGPSNSGWATGDPSGLIVHVHARVRDGRR
jgi:hypothetical protein